MKSRLLTDWLKTFDPIHQGWTRSGIANGLCMTSGRFYPRVEGGYNLYRTIDGVSGPTSELVGAAAADATGVQTFPWVRHQADRDYAYRLVPISGGGLENWTDLTITHVAFDPGGVWLGTLPNAPSDLRVMPLAGGRFLLRWTYLPQGQEVEPEGFRIYSSGDWPGVDYGSAYGTITYMPGRVHYEYVTLPWPNGKRVLWAVRAFSRTGHEERNVNHVSGEARDRGPAVNPVVSISVV